MNGKWNILTASLWIFWRANNQKGKHGEEAKQFFNYLVNWLVKWLPKMLKINLK